MHGGHIGIHFEKTFHKDVREVEQILWEKNCVKVWEFNFLSATFFCMSAILVAILKNKFYENVREVGQIL